MASRDELSLRLDATAKRYDGLSRYKACPLQSPPPQPAWGGYSGSMRQHLSRHDVRHEGKVSRAPIDLTCSGSSSVSCAGETSGDRNEASASGDEESAGASNTDEIVHFAWQEKMVLNERYELMKLLGDGTFGRVLLARDRRRQDDLVAIKVIRDVERYMANAKIEADILNDIRKADPSRASRCAIMYDTFTHESKFYCLVFEPLGESLYSFLKKNGHRGFWVEDLQSFAEQSLKALKFIHQTLRLSHTDLKPENILLVSMEPSRASHFPRESMWGQSHKPVKTQYRRPATSEIKLIDFGNATYEDEHHSSVISTRQYRGPEVVLNVGWNETSDIWSIGCIIMELYTGDLLFGTHENMEHLALIEAVLGPIPSSLLAQSSLEVKERYLSRTQASTWRLSWPDGASSQSSVRHVQRTGSMEMLAAQHHHSFAKFCKDLLVPDPSCRLSAAAALKHPFFSQQFDD